MSSHKECNRRQVLCRCLDDSHLVIYQKKGDEKDSDNRGRPRYVKLKSWILYYTAIDQESRDSSDFV
jgi:hypothetical protein